MAKERKSWLRFLKKRRSHDSYSSTPMKVPTHVGIIMDGNGRWAKQRGLPRRAGHRAGAETLHDITDACGRLGVRYMTVYAFSTENWNRPEDEVHALMSLFTEFFHKYDASLKENDVRVRFMGEHEGLPKDVVDTWIEAEKNSRDRKGMQMIVAFNYGGQKELVHATKDIAKAVLDGAVSIDAIDARLISEHLYLADVPPVDLIIRSSGEMRLSNFMIWQGAYAELWVSDILWPDFNPLDLEQAFRDYGLRDRRFGKVHDTKDKALLEDI